MITLEDVLALMEKSQNPVGATNESVLRYFAEGESLVSFRATGGGYADSKTMAREILLLRHTHADVIKLLDGLVKRMETP